MRLSMYERQILSGIEHELRKEDPRLAAHLDQLTPAEPTPHRRRRPAGWSRRKRILLTVVGVLIGIALGVLAVSRVSAPGGVVRQDMQQQPAEACPGPNSQYPEKKCVEEPAYYPPADGRP